MNKDKIMVIAYIVGIILGCYLGGYLMLFKGIIQIINAINPLQATQLAIGIIRVLFCEVGFALPIWLCLLIGSVFDE